MENLDRSHDFAKQLTVARQDGVRARAPYSEAPGYGSYELDDESAAGGLLEYWRMLRRHKKTIALFALAGTVLGILVAVPQKPIYRARTSLEVLSLNEDFLNMKQTSPVTSNDYSYDTSELQTQVKLLESDSLMKRVFAKLDPQGTAEWQPSRTPPNWRILLHMPESKPSTPREALLDKAAASVNVRAMPRTRVIELSVDSADPRLATDFVNTLAQEFIEQNIEARWQSTQKTSDWLSRELNDTRAKLEHSEDALQAYARSSGLIFTDETTNVSTEKLQQIQQELSGATAERIAKQSRFELGRNSSPDSLPDVLNDNALRATQSKITDLNRQIAELGATYTPEYGKLKRAQAQVATLQASFDRDRSAIVERIKNDFQEARQKEKLLSSAYNSQTKEVTGQGEKSIEYNILKREVDSNRQLYDTMLQQLKQSSIATAMRASKVRIVDPADRPRVPISPNLKIDAAMGLFLGLMSSIGLVIIRERADRTLQQPGDAQLWTNLPELGTIPSATVDGQKKLHGVRAERAEIPDGAPLAVAKSPAHSKNAQSVELMSWERKPSFVAEAFRSVLTSILFVGENGSRPRVLVMTSANPSDGKTTVVSNLGIAMAEIRRTVLIIDADLRRPRMHDVFHLSNERGLSDLLRMEHVSEDVFSQLVQRTAVPGLHVLTSGPSTHAAANLLYSPHLARVLAKFREQYDMVLVDTPPMLQMTDARVAGQLADAVILVARAEKTTRDALMAANQRLKEDKIRVLGTVLNDWNPKNSPGGYYGSYTGKYYSSYKADEGYAVSHTAGA